MGVGELIIFAAPAMGHLVAAVELARQLVAHHPRISITVLIPKLPIPDKNLNAYIQSALLDEDDRISLVELPRLENNPSVAESSSKRPFFIFNLLASLYKPIVKSLVKQRQNEVVGILTDMLFTQMVDVAEELGVPSYILYTSGANLLTLSLQLESLDVDVPSAFGQLPPESIPLEGFSGFRNPVPLKEWPEIFLDKGYSAEFLAHASRYRRANGILVNTFTDLESILLESLFEDKHTPHVYPIGPILHLDRHQITRDQSTLSWLDEQPQGSVVFLCFGSNASFGKQEVEQIALGIMQTGYRFLWSLRQKPLPSKGERLSSEYDDFAEILPMGFQKMTSKVGRMIGWAPQTEVLAHPAIGAFVSHCGWNSVLESLWFGVPLVAWPMYAEQHLNAFLLVRELGIAVDLTMDYKYDLVGKMGNRVVTAQEVEKGIRKIMDEAEGAVVRKKVKVMRELARKAIESGSSIKSVQCFTQEVMKNLSSSNLP